MWVSTLRHSQQFRGELSPFDQDRRLSIPTLDSIPTVQYISHQATAVQVLSAVVDRLCIQTFVNMEINITNNTQT